MRTSSLALALMVAMASTSARAEEKQPTDEQKAAARALFDEGLKLMEAKLYREACAKFEQSRAAAKGPGNTFRLAECYEHLGRITSAWQLYAEAASIGRSDDEVKIATERRGGLEARLPRVRIDVTLPTADTVVKRNDENVARELWGTSVPVDPGEIRVSASASGRKPWNGSKSVAEGQSTTIVIPALAPLEPIGGSSGWSGWRIGAVATGSVGLAALIAGFAAGGVALQKKGLVESRCSQHVDCDAEVVAANEQARTAARASTGLVVIGGAAIATGIALWLVDPSRKRQAGWVLPHVGASLVGLTAGRSF
jgi:tetratricopeptide (TPR) repeat protein